VDCPRIKVEGEGALSAACFACAYLVISATRASMVDPSAGCGARYIFLARQGIVEQTLEIRSIHCRQAIAKQSAERGVTGSNIGDPPMLPYRFDQIAPDQEIGSVTADGAYDPGLRPFRAG